jgi:hypothetical protein
MKRSDQGPEKSCCNQSNRQYKKYPDELFHIGLLWQHSLSRRKADDILESQMRKLYSLFIYLATPLVLFYFLFRGLRDRNYLKRWPERFGLFTALPSAGSIVVHAASMGEVNAASPVPYHPYPDRLEPGP